MLTRESLKTDCKVGCVSPVFGVCELLKAEFGLNKNQEDALNFGKTDRVLETYRKLLDKKLLKLLDIFVFRWLIRNQNLKTPTVGVLL